MAEVELRYPKNPDFTQDQTQQINRKIRITRGDELELHISQGFTHFKRLSWKMKFRIVLHYLLTRVMSFFTVFCLTMILSLYLQQPEQTTAELEGMVARIIGVLLSPLN